MNHLRQAFALFGCREGGAPYGTGGLGGHRSRGAAAEAGHLTLTQRKVLGELHADELRREIQHQRRIELAAVRWAAGIVQIAGEVEGKDVYREYASPVGAQGRKGLLMGIVAVRRKNNESAHAALLPRAEQVIHPAVQGLASDSRIAGVGAFGRCVDAVRNCRRPEDAKTGRQVIGQSLDDERIATKGEVGSMLLTGAHRHQQT